LIKDFSWILWKGCNELKNKNIDDLDALIINTKKEKANFFDQGIFVYREFPKDKERHFLYMNSFGLQHLHLYNSVRIGSTICKEFDITKLVNLKKRELINGYWCLDSSELIKISALRLISKYKNIENRLQMFYKWESISNEIDWNYNLCIKLRKQNELLYNPFQNNLDKQNYIDNYIFLFSSLKELKPTFRELLFPSFTEIIQIKEISKELEQFRVASRLNVIKSSIKYIIIRKFAKLFGFSKRVKSREGKIFVITGADGSGKTTIISALKRILDKRLRLKIVKFSPFFNKTISIKTLKESNKLIKSSFLKKLIESSFYLFWMIWRVYLTFYCLVLKKFGYIVICDRYLANYDSKIDGGKIHLSKNRKGILINLEKLIHKFSIKADIEIRLDTSIDTVINRNKFRNKNNKETLLEIKNRFIKSRNLVYLVNKIYTINNDGEAKKTINQLVDIILKY